MRKIILLLSFVLASLISFSQITSLYKSGSDWMLNGGRVPAGVYRYAISGEFVTLIGAQSGERLFDYVSASKIEKNAIGDLYSGMTEFYDSTEFFFLKNELTSEYLTLPGQQVGYSVVDKFGVNQDVSAGVPEDVWEFGGLYNYDANGTAPIQYLSSSDVDDTVTVTVYGLDIDGYEVEQSIALNGQSNVDLTTDLWRVFRLVNESTVSIEGVVYCHTDPSPTNGVPAGVAVRAIINDGNNQTLMALYTIPRGKVGYLHKGEVGVQYEGNVAALAEYAHIHYESRRFGKVFTVKKSFTLIVGGTSIHTDVRSFPDVIPALTDIKIKAQDVSADMGLWATFDILLVDEDKLPQSYLTAIGQPQ